MPVLECPKAASVDPSTTSDKKNGLDKIPARFYYILLVSETKPSNKHVHSYLLPSS